MNKILEGVDPHDEMAALEAWEEYLSKELSFPIDASVNEVSRRGPIHVGDRVRIHGIELVDDHYGIIVKIKRGRETFHHPLCDLKADSTSPYHDAIQLYAVWFANR